MLVQGVHVAAGSGVIAAEEDDGLSGLLGRERGGRRHDLDYEEGVPGTSDVVDTRCTKIVMLCRTRCGREGEALKIIDGKSTRTVLENAMGISCIWKPSMQTQPAQSEHGRNNNNNKKKRRIDRGSRVGGEANMC